MKNILVPVDFSHSSRNAADYAAHIALATQSKLVLYHVYSLPVSTSEVPVVLSLDEIRKFSMDALQKIKDSLKAQFGAELQVTCDCGCGYPEDVIGEYATNNHVEMVVMGLRGADYMREKLIGSTTTTLMRKCSRSVLAVGETVRFSGLKRIAFASDYNGFRKVDTLKPLKDLAVSFGAKVYVINIVKERSSLPKISEAVEGLQIDNYLDKVDHSFHYKESEDVVAGLNGFVSDNNIDMIVMIPGEHSFLERILHEPDTKRLAFHSAVPLLAIKELK